MTRAQITPYNSQQPVDDFGLRFADLKFSATLAALADTTLTIPGNAQRYKALMKSLPGQGDIWITVNAIAAPSSAPTLGELNVTTSELINGIEMCREVVSGDVIHFLSVNADIPISVVLYALNTTN